MTLDDREFAGLLKQVLSQTKRQVRIQCRPILFVTTTAPIRLGVRDTGRLRRRRGFGVVAMRAPGSRHERHEQMRNRDVTAQVECRLTDFLEQVLSCRSVSESSFAWESVKPDATLGLKVL